MNIKKSLPLRLFGWLILFQLMITVMADAQVITLSAPTTGDYYSNTSITLLPGFTSSGPFRAYITGMLNTPLASAPSQSQNYIRAKTYKVASTAEITGPLVSQQSEVIQYLDGLGRPLQTIQTKGSPSGYDIVQPVAYDAYDRETKKYLPYAEQTGNGTYRSGAVTTQAQFYGTSGWDAAVVKTTAPYSQLLYDPSPLDQLNEQGDPGTVWQPAGTRSSTAGRTMLLTYGTNDASTTNYGTTGYGVRLWRAVPVTAQPYKNTLTSSGYYAAGQLYLKITKDENWLSTDGKKGTTEEYTDRGGHMVLKRTFNTDLTILSTYYVYDDLDNLSFVLPPASNPDAATISQTVLDQFCYQYRYDLRNRQAERKIPGKGWDYLVYNNKDLPVLSQDSVQRIAGKWMFNKYDVFGRLIINGLYASAAARSTLETTLNNETIYFETPQTTGIGYTSVAYPQTAPSSYLNIQYYDDYTFPGASGYAYSASSKTKGLLTGSKTYVLGTTNALLNVNYYDDEGRISKIYKQHYQSGAVNAGNYDEVTNSYNFEGAMTASTRLHHNATSGNTTIANRYEYDHVGRKLRTFEKLNTDTEILLSENSYNEIGQLKTKALHGGLQSTSYAYNERGWLKKSTSPQFSFQLNYQDGTTPQYNGNIANQLWGAGTTLGSTFTYSYDRLNRLSSGVATGMSETLTYDLMGNISTLNRDGVTRTYVYTGNRLTSTSGAPGTGTYLYDGNGNATYDGRNEKAVTYNVLNLPATVTAAGLSYVYDATGHKLRTTLGSTVTDYVDGIQYSGGNIQFIQTEEGIARRNGTSYSYEYNLKDHLGNVRYTFYKNPVTNVADRLQSDDYYAFGLRKSSGSPVSLTNKYLYNGKELQDSLGQYDYGARFYDPVIGRWNVVDPLAENSRTFSPYVYTMANPIRYIDPDGMSAASYPDPYFSTNDPNEIFRAYNAYIKPIIDREQRQQNTDQVNVDDPASPGTDAGDGEGDPPKKKKNSIITQTDPLKSSFNNLINNKRQYLDYSYYAEASAGALQIGWKEIGNSTWVGNNISRFANFSTAGFEELSRYIGNLNYVVSLAQAGLAGKDYHDGNIGLGRFAFRTSSIGASTGVGFYIGGPLGAFTGVAVSSSATVTESAYDIVIPQLFGSYNNFINSLNSAWNSGSGLH